MDVNYGDLKVRSAGRKALDMDGGSVLGHFPISSLFILSTSLFVWFRL